jgi:hypothetical protein
MKRLALLAPLALAGCAQLPAVLANLPLPTVAEVCAIPPALRGPALEKVGSSETDMALACALLNK